MGEERPKKITTSRVFAASTVLAVVISVPAIAVTLVLHYLIKTNLIITMVAGLVTLFIAMGFAYKLSKRLAVKMQDGGTDPKKE
ncbi:MAG TPA: hypothetical protein VLA68_01100 [Nitrososphaera sp.]|nr:hypothetical protein [Nitrososphaera sp.]HEX2013799.1 hypothetical protein [Nitrososphaera sp.]